MQTRRRFLAATSAVLFAPAIVRAQSRSVLDVYIDGDTNVQDLWTNVIKPGFEAKNAKATFNVTVTRGVGSGNRLIAERAMAALQSKADPKVDFFEEVDPLAVKGAAEAGLWAKFDTATVPNLAMANPLGLESPYKLPYRGSQVLIAYDSARIPDREAPRTFAAIMDWAKAHPGRFTYGRPDKGGSGRNFVVRAVHEANGRDPSLFRPDNFDAKVAESRFEKAWVLLRELHPYTFGKGSYPAGNTPALQLLASGAVDMISAWSDQALQALSQGVLPKTVKLIQLEDLALCGGFAFSAIPTNAHNFEGAMALANYVMSREVQTSIVQEIGGFPGIGWEHLPAELKAQYIDVIPVSIPTFPSGDWNNALNAGWYRNVAPNAGQ